MAISLLVNSLGRPKAEEMDAVEGIVMTQNPPPNSCHNAGCYQKASKGSFCIKMHNLMQSITVKNRSRKILVYS